MKTQTVLTVTYINPNYEPGKTVREITETVATVKGKDLETRMRARKFVRDMMEKRRITVYHIDERGVPVF